MTLPVLSDRTTRLGTAVLLFLALLCGVAVWLLGDHTIAWLVPVPALVGAGCGEVGIRLSRRAAHRDRVLAVLAAQPGWMPRLRLFLESGVPVRDLDRALNRLVKRDAVTLRFVPAPDPRQPDRAEYTASAPDGGESS